jgi:hypothetical protein
MTTGEAALAERRLVADVLVDEADELLHLHVPARTVIRALVLAMGGTSPAAVARLRRYGAELLEHVEAPR